VLIVLNEDDEANTEHFKKLGFIPYSTELIFSGILHRKLTPEEYEIE